MGGHYIEVEVWSTEKQKEPLPVPYQLRDVLTIPTYEYSGKAPNNVTHPDVLDFTLVNGAGGTPLGTWGGHRFWMAVTPNQEGNSQFENPCLVWSDDGKIWSAEGIPNPLSVVEREPDGTHNCDNDVIYDPVSDELWVYYVWEQDAQNYGQIGTSNFKPSSRKENLLPDKPLLFCVVVLYPVVIVVETGTAQIHDWRFPIWKLYRVD